ncbi:5'-methylthioadenosine/S-adenosylhomocysteine nucleosidase [Staphylococcus aureus]
MITQSGIGRFNAAISTTLLINKFKPDVIINTPCWSLDESLNVGDVLISDDVKYHDAETQQHLVMNMDKYHRCRIAFQSSKPLIEKVSQVVQQQQLTAKVGLIVSGDSFIR